MVSLARRGFFQGKASSTAAFIRPPWAIQEDQFINACTRCGDCISACPTKIITVGAGGFPKIDFQQGACTFCADCVQVCTAGALLAHTTPVPAWSLAPAIADGCLAFNRIECRVCAESCQEDAIRFPPKLGGIAWPVINAMLCTGCGACVAPCPSAAITLKDGSCK